MTREEAIKSALKFLVRKQQEQGSWGYADNDDTHEVSWDEIIRWVDQRSCGDLISRQAALEILEEYAEDIESGNFGAYTKARISMRKLPSVEPERKTGKWIDEGWYAEGHSEHAYRCSECDEHYIGYVGEYKHCPNCGADMREVQDG